MCNGWVLPNDSKGEWGGFAWAAFQTATLSPAGREALAAERTRRR